MKPVVACRHLFAATCVSLSMIVAGGSTLFAQGLGGAGTIQGIVKDPTGGVMQAVAVTLRSPLSGFSRTVTTDAAGRYVFGNVPQNSYHITVEAQGFEGLERDVDVRSAVPIALDLTLTLAGTSAAVEVVGHAEALLER